MHVETFAGMTLQCLIIDTHLINTPLVIDDGILILTYLAAQLILLGMQAHDTPHAMLANENHIE